VLLGTLTLAAALRDGAADLVCGTFSFSNLWRKGLFFPSIMADPAIAAKDKHAADVRKATDKRAAELHSAEDAKTAAVHKAEAIAAVRCLFMPCASASAGNAVDITTEAWISLGG
jgi:hypothetical protein